MKLNEIRDKPGARQAPRRVGRGIGSGLGKTSGRGGKGQTARSGVSLNGFEGGQTPLYRRLPKRGFHNINRREFQVINLDILQAAIEKGRIDPKETITATRLVDAGVMRRARDGIRLLASGKDGFKSTITIEVAGASKSAHAAVEKAGGKIVVLVAVRPRVEKDIAAKQARRAKRLAKAAPKAAEKPAEEAAAKPAKKAPDKKAQEKSGGKPAGQGPAA